MAGRPADADAEEAGAAVEAPAAGGWRSRLIVDVSVLAGARQAGAAAFALALLVYPEVVVEAEADRFLWLYFSQLIVSSILNLGIERLTARDSSRNPEAARAHVAWGVRARVLASPLTIAGVTGVVAVTSVASPGEVVAAIAWTLVVQVQGVVLAAVRSTSGSRHEAPIIFMTKVAQAALLLVSAVLDLRVVVLVLALAALDGAAALLAHRRLPLAPAPEAIPAERAARRGLLVRYTGIEVTAFAYQRADLVLVAILLGSHEGATYGLAYRVVDGLLGLAAPAAQLLFSRGADLFRRGVAVDDLEARARRWGVAVAFVLSAGGIALTWPLGALLGRFGEGADVARLLLVVVPLSYAAAIRSHLLSAQDRNGRIVVVGALVLGVNVVGNLIVVPRHGLPGAAWVLVASEALLLLGLRPPARWGDAMPFAASALLGLGLAATAVVGGG